VAPGDGGAAALAGLGGQAVDVPRVGLALDALQVHVDEQRREPVLLHATGQEARSYHDPVRLSNTAPVNQ
jgi:hypothetical protein